MACSYSHCSGSGSRFVVVFLDWDLDEGGTVLNRSSSLSESLSSNKETW